MPSVIVKTNRARITPCKTVQRRSTKITAEVNFINGEEAKKLVEEEGTIIKRTVHNNFSGLFFGLSFTKLNPDFVKLVKEQFSTDSKLLLVCQEGLRSTAATNKLEEEGFQNLSCITSGLQSVKPGTFNSEGSSELQNAGKAGLVTVQGKISAVLGTVLICAFLFITFFPEQAEKLLQMSPVG
ncbi:Rhodanese-like domain-containing protein 9, chloroplastic [Cinnamomum micranthum f. kanehirae]|uniref:Rhodanese-like domain-containing protein 9, chloroplastic n=1 Tax=Cinnamomum micranthum f. kanehirae TaxID=337451 RepID=A0A3S3LYK0_9MAGN|nr:Rhodanese-like domain-containing protein 9, chloroplastic [Cinnamomum micranthum f. kanehirae]